MWVLVTLGKGHPDETIRAALWRMEQQGKLAGRILRSLVDLLFRPIEKDHCRNAWLSEVQRSQLPSGPPLHRMIDSYGTIPTMVVGKAGMDRHGPLSVLEAEVVPV